MQIKQTPLSDLHTNEANPRTITDGKFGKLIGSLLVLPKMLELRPIVTDSAGTALGGNMRLRALQAIADLSPEDVELRLHALPDFAKKSTAQQLALIDYWRGWLEDAKHPVPSVVADELSDGEKREFVIKDNASFGEWDWDALSNEWDTAELNEWGLDVWEPTERPAEDYAATGADTADEDYGDLQLNLNGNGEDSAFAQMSDGTGLFSVTFVFDEQYKDTVLPWIKENGKDAMVEKIVEICQTAGAK